MKKYCICLFIYIPAALLNASMAFCSALGEEGHSSAPAQRVVSKKPSFEAFSNYLETQAHDLQIQHRQPVDQFLAEYHAATASELEMYILLMEMADIFQINRSEILDCIVNTKNEEDERNLRAQLKQFDDLFDLMKCLFCDCSH